MLCGLAPAASFGQTGPADTQPSQPAPTSAAVWELPAAIRVALQQTQDFVFNFDQPGFYAVVDFVRRSPRSPGFAQAPIEVQDWRDLLERPGDFRGLPVTIEGVVGHNKDPYLSNVHPELGWLWQLELLREDQPIACTVIFTGNAADIPLNATVQVTGYFVMIRQYYDAAHQVRQAALVVAPGPTTITRNISRPTATSGPDWRWMAAAVVLGLLLTIVLLRWSARAGRRDVRTLRAEHAAPLSLADDLAAWAGEKEHEPDGERVEDHESDAGAGGEK